jgi:hypothetical protein
VEVVGQIVRPLLRTAVEICHKTGGSYTASKLTAEHPSENRLLKESIWVQQHCSTWNIALCASTFAHRSKSIGLKVMLYVEHLSLKCDYCGLNGE